MTERDIELTQRCGHWSGETIEMNDIGIEKFAALIRADEREACAKFFDNTWREEWTDEQIASAIRARGNK